MHVVIKTEQEDENYLSACARIRHISRTELVRRVVERSIKDHMVGAILDDIQWEEKDH